MRQMALKAAWLKFAAQKRIRPGRTHFRAGFEAGWAELDAAKALAAELARALRDDHLGDTGELVTTGGCVMCALLARPDVADLLAEPATRCPRSDDGRPYCDQCLGIACCAGYAQPATEAASALRTKLDEALAEIERLRAGLRCIASGDLDVDDIDGILADPSRDDVCCAYVVSPKASGGKWLDHIPDVREMVEQPWVQCTTVTRDCLGGCRTRKEHEAYLRRLRGEELATEAGEVGGE